VLVAAYGDEALSRLAQCHELAVLLTEVVLPHMSGAELAQRVSRSFPHVPTIFMSGDMDDTLARYGISECEVEFLRKPFSCGELVGKVLTAPLAWQQVA
jgi:FixJ family two-component response regulator